MGIGRVDSLQFTVDRAEKKKLRKKITLRR
jgi:hypothetical protein